MINKFIIAVKLILSSLVFNCESNVSLRYSLKSRTPTHPLKIEVYTSVNTEICWLSSIKTSETSIERIIYNNDQLDFDLCINGNQIGADIYISDPRNTTSILSLSLGAQTHKDARLFIKEGTLLLNNEIDFLVIELNELKLQISNNSINSTERQYKILSFVDLTVINSINTNNNNKKKKKKKNFKNLANNETISGSDGFGFDSVMGTVMGIITFVFMVILFCWKFQNT